MCPHLPPCPPASAPDREAARTIASHPEQGWSLLCNGVVVFEDTGELLPGGDAVAPRRPTDKIHQHEAHQRGAHQRGALLTDADAGVPARRLAEPALPRP